MGINDSPANEAVEDHLERDTQPTTRRKAQAGAGALPLRSGRHPCPTRADDTRVQVRTVLGNSALLGAVDMSIGGWVI